MTTTNEEIRAILADLSAAQRALRDSNEAIVDTIGGMQSLLVSMREAAHAHGQAMDAVIAATDKALALFDAGRSQ